MYSRTSELAYRTWGKCVVKCIGDGCRSAKTVKWGKADDMKLWWEKKIYISTQKFHDFIKIYPVKLHCYLLVQKSDYLPITCTAPVSFAHFHAHSSVSYFFNANGFHPHSLLISLHRRWWRWNEEFTTSDTWHWADDLIMVVWLCRAHRSSHGNGEVDSKS